MMYGISGASLPVGLAYGPEIENASIENNFPPCLAYAVAYQETINGEKLGLWVARTVVSDDNGHGLFQLTSSWPKDWEDPYANAQYAVINFLRPSLDRFGGRGLLSDDLVRCVAAAFNEGEETAWLNHLAGNVDAGTTRQNYGATVLGYYHKLISGHKPA